MKHHLRHHEHRHPGSGGPSRAAEDRLYRAILGLESVKECRAFFRDLTTPAELEALTDRWRVVDLVDRAVPYRKIHDQTGVSVTTIGRVARFLTTGHGGYRLALERQRTCRDGTD